jgi:hypothetical protein
LTVDTGFDAQSCALNVVRPDKDRSPVAPHQVMAGRTCAKPVLDHATSMMARTPYHRNSNV